MKTINLEELGISNISLCEMKEINGGDWNKGFDAGTSDGYNAGKGILAGITIIGIWSLFL